MSHLPRVETTSERPRPRTLVVATFIIALSAFAPRSGFAAGFEFFEQGSKAKGMAGAFVAQADDPTAIFYNIGGLALADGKKAALGLTVNTLNESLYQGLSPGIGAGTAAEQDEYMALQPHVYLALPMGPSLKVGVGIYSPFFHDASWIDLGSFAGREISTGSELVVYDLNPSVAYALTPKLGVGFGLVYRTSELSQRRRVFADNPFTGEAQDVATVEVASDFSDGLGWNAGILHKLSDRFSWGFAYRSGFGIDYTGVGRLTQILTGNPQLDELFAATLPFDQDLATSSSIDFPESATFGVAYGLTKAILLEADVHWTGWSGIDRLLIDFPTLPLADQEIRLDFDDALSLRFGFQYTTATGTHFRAGFAIDETPQPDSTVGALIADGNRTLLAVGFGKDPLDVAFSWVDVEQRIITNQVDGLNGNYRSSAWMLGLTISL